MNKFFRTMTRTTRSSSFRDKDRLPLVAQNKLEAMVAEVAQLERDGKITHEDAQERRIELAKFQLELQSLKQPGKKVS